MVELSETSGRLELVSPMPTGARAALVLIGLFPLIAPYDLLVRTEWTGYLNPFFAFAALISAGAIAVSLGFLFAGVAGLSSRLVLDAGRSELVHSAVAPVMPRRTRVYPLSSIDGAEIRTRDWSEGSPTYSLAVSLFDGTVLESGSISSRDEAEAHLRRVTSFLGWHLPRKTRGDGLEP